MAKIECGEVWRPGHKWSSVRIWGIVYGQDKLRFLDAASMSVKIGAIVKTGWEYGNLK
jgi:hypothetical protein